MDELLIGSKKGKRGRNKGEKKLVVIAVEKVKENKMGVAYEEVIGEASGHRFNPFLNDILMTITHRFLQTAGGGVGRWRVSLKSGKSRPIAGETFPACIV